MTDAKKIDESPIIFREKAVRIHRSEQKSQMLGQFAHGELAKIAKGLTVQQLQLIIRNAALVDAIKDATKQHDRVRDLYELAPFGHLTLDKNGHITRLNRAAAEIFAHFNLQRQTFIGRHFSFVVAEKSLDALDELLREAWHSKDKTCTTQLELRCGKYLPVYCKLQKLTAQSFDPDQLSLAIIDETRVRTTIDDVAKNLLFG